MYRLVVRRHKDVIVGQMDLNDKIGWENNTNNTCIVGCAKEVHNAAQANFSHKSEVVSGGKLNSQTQRGGLYVDWSGLIPWKNSETMESRRLDWSEIYEGILVTRQYYISSMILHRAQRTSFQSSRKIIPNPSFFFLAGSLLAITYLRSQNSKFKFLDEFGKSRTRRWHACGSTPSPTIHAALPPIHPSYPPVVK